MGTEANLGEAGRSALRREGSGLLVGPPVAGQPGGTGLNPAFDREQPTMGREDPARLRKSPTDIGPVVHGRDRPQDRCRTVRNGQVFRNPRHPGDTRSAGSQQLRKPQHYQCRIDPRHPGASAGGFPRGRAWTAPDVDNMISSRHACEVCRETGHVPASHDHDEAGQESGDPDETLVIGVMIYRTSRCHGASAQPIRPQVVRFQHQVPDQRLVFHMRPVLAGAPHFAFLLAHVVVILRGTRILHIVSHDHGTLV
jgi:hypothetical protein